MARYARPFGEIAKLGFFLVRNTSAGGYGFVRKAVFYRRHSDGAFRLLFMTVGYNSRNDHDSLRDF